MWILIALIPKVLIRLPLYFIAVGVFQTVTEIFHRPPYWFSPLLAGGFSRDALMVLFPCLRNSLIIALGNFLPILMVALPAPLYFLNYVFDLVAPLFWRLPRCFRLQRLRSPFSHF
ncbi:MAG: hypothetical protein HPY68_10605 [Candidatus Atribacteria bacterium]|nr:hypothetical protein [Candidatus Atribacteria bacterium]